MFCSILCLLNCMTETIQVTEGRMLVSPDLRGPGLGHNRHHKQTN